MKYDVIIICNNYSERLEAVLFYWSQMDYAFTLHVVTNQQDLKTQKVVSSYIDKINIRLHIYSGNKIHNKGYLIKYCLDRIQESDYIVLTDADMVFHKDLLLKTSLYLNEETLISSFREDISEIDVDLFFSLYKKKRYTWVWDDVKREMVSRSPFMGWFLVFPFKVVNKIDFHVNHEGYDIIDWKIYGQLLSLGLKERLVYFDYSPLHIYHGEKGKNWKGI